MGFVLVENSKIPLKYKYARSRRYACPLLGNRDVSRRGPQNNGTSTGLIPQLFSPLLHHQLRPTNVQEVDEGMCWLWSRGMPRDEYCANHRSLLQRTRRNGTRCRHKSWGRVNRRLSKAFCPRTLGIPLGSCGAVIIERGRSRSSKRYSSLECAHNILHGASDKPGREVSVEAAGVPPTRACVIPGAESFKEA